MPLSAHQLRAVFPQLDPRIAVYAVVDAAVVRYIAAGHAGVRGVHDRIAAQSRNVAAPDIQPAAHRREAADVRYALGVKLRAQVLVLHAEKLRAALTRRAHVHQRAEQEPLLLSVRRDTRPAVFRALVQKRVYEKTPPFGLIHSVFSPFDS